MTDFQRDDSDVDTPLTENEIRTMFCGFLRYPSLLKDALSVSGDESRFRGGEQRYFTLLVVLRRLHEEYGLVSRQMLETELLSLLEAQRITLSNDDIVFLFGASDDPASNAVGLIADAFENIPADEAQQRAERQFMEAILRRFMNVRYLKPRMQTFLNRGTEDTAPEQLKEFLDRFGRIAQRVEYIGTPTVNAAAMPAFGSPIVLPPPAMPSGIAWIDQYIGGFRPGDLIGLLAPYGGGKTTLLSIAAVRMAELYFAQNINKLAVFVGYEDNAERMSSMFWSAATRIARNLFTASAGTNFWEQLSTQNNLKDYDRLLPENRNGQIVFGERERWDAALAWFNRHFVFLDFSRNSTTGNRGAGGVIEIKESLERLAEERGMEIGMVCIDYIGIMCERMLASAESASAKTDMHALIRPIKQAPDDIRTMIAVPMQCSVMVAHQLSQGEVKKLKPYQYVSHADSSFSKSFAENLHSCLCINQRDLQTRVSTLFWSKIRLGVPLSYHGLIRLDDTIVDAALVNDSYVACPITRAIIERNAVRVAAAPTQGEQPDNNRRRGWDVDEFAGDMT